MSATDVDNRELQSSARKVLSNPKSTPIEKLRSQCLLRGATGIHGFGRQFRIMDDDGNRCLSKEEFVKSCHDFGCDLSLEDVDSLFKQIDRDGSGSINFDELLRALRPPMSASRIAITKKAFEKMDKSGDGRITPEDIRRVYQVRHHPKFQTNQMSESDVYTQFLKTFETGSSSVDGIVTWDEYLNYYSGISASIDTDAYYDLMMRNSYKL